MRFTREQLQLLSDVLWTHQDEGPPGAGWASGALSKLRAEVDTALAEPEHRMGPTDDELLSLDQLRDAWNAQADAMNSWDELGIDEIIWWAQRQALARWGTPSSRSNYDR